MKRQRRSRYAQLFCDVARRETVGARLNQQPENRQPVLVRQPGKGVQRRTGGDLRLSFHTSRIVESWMKSRSQRKRYWTNLAPHAVLCGMARVAPGRACAAEAALSSAERDANRGYALGLSLRFRAQHIESTDIREKISDRLQAAR